MRWIVFLVLAYVTLGLEVSLRRVLEIGDAGIAPSLTILLAVVVSLHAPARAAIWASLLLGLSLDLLNEYALEQGGGVALIIGPYAIGYVMGCALLLQLRTMLMRRNPATIGFCVFVASLFVHLVVLAFLTIRSWYDPIAFSLGREMAVRGGSALYSALLALPFSVLIPVMIALLDLPTQTARWTPRRT
jgi:cell shape-determining protein MreD